MKLKSVFAIGLVLLFGVSVALGDITGTYTIKGDGLGFHDIGGVTTSTYGYNMGYVTGEGNVSFEAQIDSISGGNCNGPQYRDVGFYINPPAGLGFPAQQILLRVDPAAGCGPGGEVIFQYWNGTYWIQPGAYAYSAYPICIKFEQSGGGTNTTYYAWFSQSSCASPNFISLNSFMLGSDTNDIETVGLYAYSGDHRTLVTAKVSALDLSFWPHSWSTSGLLDQDFGTTPLHGDLLQPEQ